MRGPIVTHAQGVDSWHNFGVAWDFVIFDSDGQPLWESPLMESYGKIAESLDLEWGGTWTNFQDTPHIQLNKCAKGQTFCVSDLLCVLNGENKRESFP